MDLVMSLIENGRNWAKRQLAPVSIGLMAALVILSFVFWFTQGKFMKELMFLADWPSRPWTIFTYPYAYMGLGDVWAILISIMVLGWMNLTCTGVERTIGSPKFVALWLALTVLPALCIWCGELTLRVSVPLGGPFLPLAGTSYIWARNHKDFQISIWFFPVNGLWISWIIIAGIIFGYGMGAPLLGLFAAAYLIPSHLYAENKIPGLPYEVRGYQNYKPSKAQKLKEANYFAEVDKRKRERAERERLRKLFESSLDDDKK